MQSPDIQRLKEIACEAIDAEAEHLNTISQEIWKNPELFYQEFKAHKLLTDYFSRKGFDVTPSFKLETAFRASYGKQEADRPNIAVLCEYDALPDVDHGCGHNLIAEVGAAAAIGIQAAMKSTDIQFGQLTVLGTPAEEAGGGKVDLIQAGVFFQYDAALMAHPGNITSPSTIILTCTEVFVTFKGRASHAAGSPWEGINALDAAVLAYQNVSCLRQQIKPTWRIHGVILNGGSKPNIIPEETLLHFYLRTPTRSELEAFMEKATACFDGAAKSTGCTVEYKWDPKPYLNMLSNETMKKSYRENAESLGVEFCTDESLLSTPTGSTDMGNVSHVVPAIHPHFFMGTRESAHTHVFREAAGSAEAQPYTLAQGKALAMTAIDLFTRPELLQEAKDNFVRDKELDAAAASSSN